MDMIDTIRFNADKKTHTQEEILDAYKAVFSPDNPQAMIVMQDMMAKVGYGSLQVSTDTNMYYHQSGSRQLIDIIKVMLNTTFKPDELEETLD